MTAGTLPEPLADWLLDADPAIRWQVLRDLLDAPDELVAEERSRVAREGWGARLLALQGRDGLWAHGTYRPGDVAEVQGQSGPDPGSSEADGEADLEPPVPGTWEDDPQPWTATHYSLLLLRDLGADPADPAVSCAVDLAAAHSHWPDGGRPFFEGEVEACVNGMVVSIGSTFGKDVDTVVGRLLGEQLADDGWNCWAMFGARRASFHTTLNVLEGLLAHERATGGSSLSRKARQRGEEYLLERSLFRRRSTGEVGQPVWLEFAFPTRWHYDVLRALDYFRDVGGPPDLRLAEAVEVLRSRRQPDGTWLLDRTHRGEVNVGMEVVGVPSRWNTLRALRVLRWYDAG